MPRPALLWGCLDWGNEGRKEWQIHRHEDRSWHHLQCVLWWRRTAASPKRMFVILAERRTGLIATWLLKSLYFSIHYSDSWVKFRRTRDLTGVLALLILYLLDWNICFSFHSCPAMQSFINSLFLQCLTIILADPTEFLDISSRELSLKSISLASELGALQTFC